MNLFIIFFLEIINFVSNFRFKNVRKHFEKAIIKLFDNMTQIEDWHTHNILCGHAKGTLEEYALEAINKNLRTLGFSDHFPYEMLSGLEGIPYEEYSMSLKEIETYILKAKNLRERFKDKINIRIGFELDYIKNQEALQKPYLDKISSEIDYILGSLHLMDTDKNKKWCVDDNRFREEFERQGVDRVYRDYYGQMRKMIKSRAFDFDIVSHFDLPKKYKYFPTNKEKIKDEVHKTLNLIKEKNLVIEINTGGLRKEVGEQYPEISIIKQMKDLNIPVLLGSDAHNPQEIAYEFENTIKLLKDIGYDKLVHFKERKISYLKI
jgi:histidinol-phosphatase (PHP family)